MPINHFQPDTQTDILWATPTSGYGHEADELPLPYIHASGLELTPRFGGEPGTQPLAFQCVGLPFGFLQHGWPILQRLFNAPRRRINLYWKELFRSRCGRDGCFLFRDQLAFESTADGFYGDCPILSFQRSFLMEAGLIEVHDRISFKSRVVFSSFNPLAIPLFPDWSVNTCLPKSLNLSTNLSLRPAGEAISPTGRVVLWQESIPGLSARKGDTLSRIYNYRWT